MQTITLNLTEVSDLDPTLPTVRKKRVIMPKPHPQVTGEETLLEAALRIYSNLDQPYAGVIGNCLDFKSGPTPGVTTVGTPAHFSIPAPIRNTTLTLGPSVSAGAVISLGLSGGLFFSLATPHIGLYGSVDFGVVTDFGAAAVAQVMVLFGAPSAVLNGPPTILVGVNASGPKIITASGFLVFHETVPAWTMIGAGFALGIGASVMPVSVFITKSIGVTTA